jgi:hypothetical protein
MTDHEKELLAALEADVQTWEFVAGYFEHSVSQIDTIEGKSLSGSEYAASLRHRIAEHRELIKSVKTG